MNGPLQFSEIILFTSLVIACFSFLLLLFNISFRENLLRKIKINNSPHPPKKEKLSIVEVFDYLGTKIMQEEGKYTVNENGIVKTFPSWEKLPQKYQKMVKELDKRSDPMQNKNADGFFMEVINGIYYVTMPNGKKKRYNSLKDIPVRIRKLIGK